MDANDTRPTPGRQERDAGRGSDRPVIRFGEAYSTAPLMERLPDEEFLLNLQQARQLRRKSPQVYFTWGVLQDIRRDLAQSPRVERGGLLVGHPFRDRDEPRTNFTVVDGTIPQPSRDSSVGHYTVTPDMIDRARRTLENRFPGGAVVGWYHSHPGHGVFLSGQDMTIVRNIYNAPWQIAFVRDTVRDQEGVFYGPEGARLEGWLELEAGAADFMRAADLYSLLRDAPDNRRPELMAELRALVAGSRFLGHWRRLGRYQELLLSAEEDYYPEAAAPPPAPVSIDPRAEIDLIDRIALFEPSPYDPATEPPEPVSPPASESRTETEAREKIMEQCRFANSLAEKGNIGSGLDVLRPLADKHRNISYIHDLIRYWEDVDRQSRPKRPGRPDEPYPG